MHDLGYGKDVHTISNEIHTTGGYRVRGTASWAPDIGKIPYLE